MRVCHFLLPFENRLNRMHNEDEPSLNHIHPDYVAVEGQDIACKQVDEKTNGRMQSAGAVLQSRGSRNNFHRVHTNLQGFHQLQ